MSLFFGMYRGKVVDNVDPEGRARVKVQVPEVLISEVDSWAMPSTPYAGPNVGFFAVPPIGADIWVQFEGGTHTRPVWTGCYWTKEEDVPVSPASPDVKAFVTEGIFFTHNNIQDGSATVAGVAVQKGFTLRVGSPIIDSGFLQLFLGVDGLIEVNNNDQEIIRMNAQNIQIIKENQSIITLTKPDITLTTDPCQVQMLSGSNEIQLTNRGSSVKMSTSGIDSTHGSGEIDMSDSSVTVSFGNATVQLGASGIHISYMGSSIQMAALSVNVNEGALEVT